MSRKQPLVPQVSHGGDEITVGGGGHELHAWRYTSGIVIIGTGREDQTAAPLEVTILSEEARALGKQLCKWARDHRRYERQYRLAQVFRFLRKGLQ